MDAELTNKILTERNNAGDLAAIDQLLSAFELAHPNFQGIKLYPSTDDKRLILTTEGKFGETEPQIINAPENLLNFPLEFVGHLLAHEFVHIEQRARPDNSQSREEREFEAYYQGIFPTKLTPPPDWLRIQFVTAVERYYQRMTEEEKTTYRHQYEQVMEEKAAIERRMGTKPKSE